MKEKWVIDAKGTSVNEWAEELNVSPLMIRILCNRGVNSIDEVRRYLSGEDEPLISPFELKDMDKACEIILEAIHSDKHIRVIGDYDIDGVTSSFILVKTFRALGGNVSVVIPNRVKDGYGMNDTMIRGAAEDNVNLIVTCDNGIAAVSQIELANDLNIGVVITDHHGVPFETLSDGSKKEIIPDALAVVDPWQSECSYPHPEICGAMVAYKLFLAMLEKTGLKELEQISDDCMMFAAFGTVGDVMPLRGENRKIVKNGLKLFDKTRNIGMKALMNVNGLSANAITSYHLGFVLGPCVNAAGRLDSAMLALNLFLTDVPSEAIHLANKLKELNDSRKNLTNEGVDAAERCIDQQALLNKKVWVIYIPELHESVAGIVAGKIREKYNHPVFVLTKGEDGAKGSGRSIETYNMFEHMMAVKEVFTKFGGHSQAAGLSLPEENIALFDQLINEKCLLTEEEFIPKIHIDAPVPVSQVNLALAKSLEILEPTGTGNDRPLFGQMGFKINKASINPAGTRLVLTSLQDNGGELVIFGAQRIEDFGNFINEKYGAGSYENLLRGSCDYEIGVLYRVGVNSFRGNVSCQIVMEHYC